MYPTRPGASSAFYVLMVKNGLRFSMYLWACPPMRNSDLSEISAARSYRWVWIWLVLGVLFALLLLFNSVRDYFFVARILSVQQVRHQVTERIASFDRALAENPPSDQPLVNLLAAE